MRPRPSTSNLLGNDLKVALGVSLLWVSVSATGCGGGGSASRTTPPPVPTPTVTSVTARTTVVLVEINSPSEILGQITHVASPAVQPRHGLSDAVLIDSKAGLERHKLLAEAEANRIRVTLAADAER